MMKKLHISIAVASIEESVKDYSARFEQKPDLVIDRTYALWRTPTLNFSIREESANTGKLRHLGWEDASAASFTADNDVNGIPWENFNPHNQADEINSIWPGTGYAPKIK